MPIWSLEIQDTNNKEKMAKIWVGPLICWGDSAGDSVTFRSRKSFIEAKIDSLNVQPAIDVVFQFRTTIQDALLIHFTGDDLYEFITITIKGNY